MTPQISERDIRMFIGDRAELNTLIDGVMWSSEEIENAMLMAVDFYNLQMPISMTQYCIESFPYRSILLLGTCGFLLKGAAVNQAVNNLTYSAEGVQISDKDKAGIFTQLGQGFIDEFKEGVRNIKITENVAGFYSINHSEYSFRGY